MVDDDWDRSVNGLEMQLLKIGGVCEASDMFKESKRTVQHDTQAFSFETGHFWPTWYLQMRRSDDTLVTYIYRECELELLFKKKQKVKFLELLGVPNQNKKYFCILISNWHSRKMNHQHFPTSLRWLPQWVEFWRNWEIVNLKCKSLWRAWIRMKY